MIVLNVLVMFACYYLFFDTTNPVNLPMMIGTMYGAVTNTPGLGAANEALLPQSLKATNPSSLTAMRVHIHSVCWVLLALQSLSVFLHILP